MALNEPLLEEFRQEVNMTRKMLERIPVEKFSFQPHEKSMSLGKLSSHIAESPIWIPMTIENDEWDSAKKPYASFNGESAEEILKEYEIRAQKGILALESASDEVLNEVWTFRAGEKIFFQMPRKIVLRNFVLNHQVHHRGQLSVYLRLLNIAVPGMYGPSADEKISV